MRKTLPARVSDTHRAPICHLGAFRRQNPSARTLVFSVFIIYGRAIHYCYDPSLHRARSRFRDEERLGCFMFFILGFLWCCLMRMPRPPPALAAPGLTSSTVAFS